MAGAGAGARGAGAGRGAGVTGGGAGGVPGRAGSAARVQLEQLDDEPAQLVARERDAARAEVVVDGLADRVGDFRRRAAAFEDAADRAIHLAEEGDPRLLHLARAIGIATLRKYFRQ